jgi:O-antigen/teichoic acid export membrane protein
MTDQGWPTGRGEEYRGARAATNALATFGGNILVIIIALVTTPILLRKVGLIEFGVIGLATVTMGYLSSIDPGFGGMVVRYGAKGRAERHSLLGARVATVGSLAWLVIGLALAPVVLWGAPFLLHQAHYHPGLAHSATIFFDWSYALMIGGALSSMVSSQLVAAGEQYLTNLIDVLTRMVYGVVLVVLLLRGWRLSAVLAATVVQTVLSYLITVVLVHRRHGGPYADPRSLPTEVRREIRHFGGRFQLNAILDTLTYETDPLVITLLVNTVATGLWSIANRLARQVTYFGYAANSSILPSVSAALAAGEGVTGLRRIYQRANQIIVLNGVVLAGLVCAVGPLLLKLWLGWPYHQASTAIILVAIAMAAGTPRPATAAAIFALGQVGVGVRAQALAFGVNLVLTLALVGPWHLSGVLVGTVVAKVVATGYLLVRFCRLVEGRATDLILPWLLPLVGTVGGAATLGHLAMDQWSGAFATRWSALLAVGVLGLAYLLIVMGGLRLFGYFSRTDLEWLRQSLPRALRPFLPPQLIRLLGADR